MNKTLKTIAAGLLLGSTAMAPMASAQSSTPATPSAPTMDAPATNDAAPAVKPPLATTTGDSAAAPGAYLTQQSETQISANTYIGQNVYNAADEDIGSITDLIFEKDGGVVAAIVGVGGFLGMGEKNVAVPMDKITVTQNAEGDDMKLTTVETAESLKAAPEFKMLDEKRAADASSNSSILTDKSTTSSTVKP